MMRAGIAQSLCAVLVILLTAPPGVAQKAPVPTAPGAPLAIQILEGNNAVNSIPLVRSVPVVVEIRDSNDFPVDGASVTFILPAEGPGGSFPQSGKTFSTKSDSRGQAASPPFAPVGEGRFQIVVTAAAGTRTAQTAVSQTNAGGTYAGAALPRPPFYKRKLFWAAVGGAATAIVLVVVLKGSKSSNPTVVVTPGPPVFQ